MSKAQTEYDHLISEIANSPIHVKNDGKKAIIELLHIAKCSIDNMHPDTREVHDISQSEIREIERDVREKFAHTMQDEKGWYEIELTEREVKAIHDGLTEKRFNDSMKDRHLKIDNLL